MVKTWTEEVEEAREVIEPIVAQLDPQIKLNFRPSYEFDLDEIALDVVSKHGRARVLVTFEAWTNAKTDASKMKAAFQQVLDETARGRNKQVVFAITSTGLVTKPRRTPKERLMDQIADIEADAEIERFKKSMANL